jgi:hypothetical protein
MKEFNPPAADKCLKSKKERIRRYRRFVYKAGSLNKSEKGNVKVIEDRVLEKERSRAFELSRSDRFRYRTRYFTDSCIIGSKEFVSTNFSALRIYSNRSTKRIPNRSRCWMEYIR